MENTAKLWLCKVTVFQLYTVNTEESIKNQMFMVGTESAAIVVLTYTNYSW